MAEKKFLGFSVVELLKKRKNINDSEKNNTDESIKNKLGDAANNWIAKNRSLTLRQTPFWAQSITALLICLGSISLVGSIFFRIEEVISATGQLKSIGGTVDVKAPVGGRIAEVFFEDGQVVKKGQPLAKFDTRQALQDKKTYLNLITLEEKQLTARLTSLNSQQLSFERRKDVLMRQVSTKKNILKEYEKLVSIGGFQKVQYLQQQDQVFALESQINEVDEQINRLNIEIENARLQSLKSIDQMKNSLQRSLLLLQYQNIVSPIDGVVFNPSISVSGVVSAGETMLSVVSQNGLFAEVFIPNKDIGYIKPGQETAVRVDAFPFSRFGEIKGSVTQISADALPPSTTLNYYHFPVKINLSRSYLGSSSNQIPLKPGMSISANLRLRDKPVISLVSDVFVDQVDSVKSIRQQ